MAQRRVACENANCSSYLDVVDIDILIPAPSSIRGQVEKKGGCQVLRNVHAMRRCLQRSCKQCRAHLRPEQLQSAQAVQKLTDPSCRLSCRVLTASATFGSADVAVVGGGVMGLTTALMIKQQFSDVSVDIIAEKSFIDSTSHGAAGLWEPYQIAGTSDEDINRWCVHPSNRLCYHLRNKNSLAALQHTGNMGKITYDRFDSLRSTSEGALAGVQFVTCHTLRTNDPSDAAPAPESTPAWAHIAHNFTTHTQHHTSTQSASFLGSVDVSGHELSATDNYRQSYGNGSNSRRANRKESDSTKQNIAEYEAGTNLPSLLSYGGKLTLTQEFGTYIVDQTYYLPFLAAQVQELGVQHHTATVERFDDLVNCGYKCVFNCAGLGARELAGDKDLVPVRGQVRRVRAPWVKHAMFLDSKYYILPNVYSVVVGGTAQHGDERTAVDWDDHKRIWDNVLHMCPSLETAETLTDWVGLRPLRTSGVRLERDDVSVATDVPVIHNYGHGGSGITLHWGCAQEAVSLATPELRALQVATGGAGNASVQHLRT